MSKKELKKFKPIRTDEEAENALDEDLSEYDFSQFRPMSEVFEFKPKDKSVYLRLSEALLEAVKTNAEKEGLPIQRYIRRALEEAVSRQERTEA
ncbi:MAG: CopG family antitoxin [Pseudomonadota bacterium]